MKEDLEYSLKVVNSKIYGLRDAIVSNAETFTKFKKDTSKSFDICRKRITRVEKREAIDRFLILCLVGHEVKQYISKRFGVRITFKDGIVKKFGNVKEVEEIVENNDVKEGE
ncbi:MAG: hypothetical protein J5617_03685 [Bacilli bacterium]|nr:hypothetical protein [Bacilli bacterium]